MVIFVPVNSITLSQVLDAMDAGVHFSIAFVTADRHKKRGGEYVTIEHCWKHAEPKRSDISKKSQPVSFTKKNPNHFENRTRNLRLPNGEIRKVHIRLIRHFNGKTVI